MSSLNQVTLIGNVGQDPEVRYTSSGTAVTNLSIATSRRWKDKTTGDQMEETDWHRVQLWGRQAEIAGEYIKKGSKVSVVGRLHTREYDKDGEKRYVTEVVAEQLILLSSQKQESSERRRPEPRQAERPAQRGGSVPYKDGEGKVQRHAFDDMDDDIPF